MVLADLTWHDGAPVVASPRQILKAQTDRLAQRGLTALAGTELEFIVFNGTYAAAQAAGYRDLVPANSLQRGLLHPGHRPDRAAAAPAAQRDGRCRAPGRVGQGRVQPGPARDGLPLRRRGDHLRQPLDLQDRGQGDRRRGRHEHHVHGQAERPGGQLLPHPPVGPGRQRPPGHGRGRPARAVRLRRALHRRAAGRAAGADPVLRAEHQLLQAVRAGQLRPHRGALGRGQPHLRAAARRARRGRSGWRTGCRAATSTPTWRWPR